MPGRWLGAWLAGPRSVVRLPGRALVAVAGPRLAAAGLAARVWGVGLGSPVTMAHSGPQRLSAIAGSGDGNFAIPYPPKFLPTN